MLNEAIKLNYPTAIPEIDYSLADYSDGVGPRIVTWNAGKLGPKPTIEDLGPAILQVTRKQRVTYLREHAQERLAVVGGADWDENNLDRALIDLLYRAVKRHVVLTSNTGDSQLQAFDAKFQKVLDHRDAEKTIEAEINASSDPASIDIENSPNWP